MSEQWEDFIDSFRDNIEPLLKDEIKSLIDFALNDTDDFVRRQGEKINRYLNQLAEDKITKTQYQGYMEDIRDLVEMHMLKLEVRARAGFQRLFNGIVDILLNKLLSIV